MGKLYERLWGGVSCLALAMFGLAVTEERAAAGFCVNYDLVAAQALALGETNFAPNDEFCSSVITNSTTQHDTITTVILPGDTVVAPGAPQLQSQLGQVLAGPNGLQTLNALGDISAPPILTFIDRQSNGSTLVVTLEDSIGPTGIFIGDNRSVRYFVLANSSNLNINSDTEFFFTDIFQAAINLNASSVDWLSGDLHTTFQTVLLDDGFGFTDLLLGRGRERGAAAAAAPVLLSYAKDDLAAPRGHGGDGWSVWTKGSFAHASFDGSTGNYGFSSRSWNGAFGLDYASGDFVFGAAAGLGRANVKQAVTGDFGELSTLKTGAYASWRPGAWTLTGAVSAGFSGIDATRLTLLPTPALSSYNARSFSAGLEAARRIDVSPDSFIEPMAGLVYTHLHTGAFTETGGGGLGISGNAANVDALKLYLGARASTTIVTASGMKVTPELRARLSYDALSDPRGFIARMVADVSATPFAVTGLQPNRIGGMIGAGVTLDFSPTWQANASYDVEIRGGDVSHALHGGLKVKF